MKKIAFFLCCSVAYMATNSCSDSPSVTLHTGHNVPKTENVLGSGTGNFLTPNGVMTFAYTEVEDGYMVSDDMLFPKTALIDNQLSLLTFSSLRRLWPNGEIPYEVAGDFHWWEGLEHAKNQFTRTAKVRLVPKNSSHTKWLMLTHEGGNSDACGTSFVGAYHSAQKVYLNNSDESCRKYQKHVVLHELMHAAGALHEHERPDRDNYLKSAQGGALNIPKYTGDSYKKWTEYDYYSVTHYGTAHISDMRKSDGSRVEIMDNLSSRDIEGLNDLYNAGIAAQKNGCYVTVTSCPAQLSVDENTAIRDDWDGSGSSKDRCLRRASEYMNWCQTPVGQRVTAAYYVANVPNGSQTVNGTFAPAPPRPTRTNQQDGCYVKVDNCSDKRDMPSNTWFRDEYDGASGNVDRCMRRAAEFANWCDYAKTASVYFVSNQMKIKATSSQKDGCYVKVDNCSDKRDVPSNKWFRDEYDGASGNADRCMRRAAEFANWCDNAKMASVYFSVDGKKVKNASSQKDGCYVKVSSCQAHPTVPTNQFFRDDFQSSSTDVNRCMKRAKDYSDWCKPNQDVAVYFLKDAKKVKQTSHKSDTSGSLSYRAIPGWSNWWCADTNDGKSSWYLKGSSPQSATLHSGTCDSFSPPEW